MNYYNYRWYFAVFVSALLQVIGYFYLLKTPINELQVLHKKERALMEIMQEIDPNKIHYHPPSSVSNEKMSYLKSKNKFDVMTEIIKLSNRNHLNFSSISPASFHELSSDFISLKVIAQGRFQDFMRFLFATREQSGFIQVEDFSVQLMNDHDDHLNFIISLWLLKNKVINQNNKLEEHDEQKVNANQPQLFCPPQGFHLSW